MALTMLEFLTRLAALDIAPLFTAYVVMVMLSPLWRKVMSPIKPKTVMIIYNLLCSLLSGIAMVGMVYHMIKAKKIYTNTTTPGLIPYYRLYAFTKVLELMDTVFMILGHRTRQITILHVFHHSTMLILVHYALQYSPWTALAPGLAINSFIHLILYWYYAITIMDKSQRPGWKRHLTEMQIVQFVIDIVYSSAGYVWYDFCMWSMIYAWSMMILFCNFYYRAYLTHKSALSKSNSNKSD